MRSGPPCARPKPLLAAALVLHARVVFVPLPLLLVHEILLRVLPALLLFLGARSLTPWGRLFTSAEQALQPHLQARSYPALSSRANACGRAAATWRDCLRLRGSRHG